MLFNNFSALLPFLTYFLFLSLSIKHLMYCTEFSYVCAKSGLVNCFNAPPGSTSFGNGIAMLPKSSHNFLRCQLVHSIAGAPLNVVGAQVSSSPWQNSLSVMRLTSCSMSIASWKNVTPRPMIVTFCKSMVGLSLVVLLIMHSVRPLRANQKSLTPVP